MVLCGTVLYLMVLYESECYCILGFVFIEALAPATFLITLRNKRSVIVVQTYRIYSQKGYGFKIIDLIESINMFFDTLQFKIYSELAFYFF